MLQASYAVVLSHTAVRHDWHLAGRQNACAALQWTAGVAVKVAARIQRNCVYGRFQRVHAYIERYVQWPAILRFALSQFPVG